ncbi:hypothetical protein H5410_045118 [Solanum commersonii]|uniref:Uncharacterized protein n=1 Tax=Solanum commersonii TaxID=4109 RepID=A0A9J5XBV0_SOLCO|nr:hypothetical protein H5410_045118 [Solanum commersonii]
MMCSPRYITQGTMTLVLRYVNKDDEEAIYVFLLDHSLSPSQIRGQEYQAEKLEELLISREVHICRGLNQECELQCLGDTRWSSHYRTLDSHIILFPSIIHVLEFTRCECPNYIDKLVAQILGSMIKKFDFTFMLRLMWTVLMMTNELSSSLQRMKDIVNAMRFLALTK